MRRAVRPADRVPYVVALVLNWNGTEDTIECLRSLRTTDWGRFTTLVVDNGSDDDLGQALQKAGLGWATLIRNDRNLGFAGGMNAGIRQAVELEADYVLLLNNDTVVDPSMVRRLVEAALAQPRVGMVSPLEFFRDAPAVVAAAGRRMNLRRAYQGPPLHMGELDDGQFGGVEEIDVSSGTAMLVPTAVVREVGLLDEDLYLYVEDVDWSMRIREAGLRIYVAYDARVWHGVASSSGGEDSPDVTYYHVRNSLVVVDRHEPLGKLRRRLRHLEIVAANLVHAARCRRPLQNGQAVLDGWRDYRHGRLGPRPDCGL
jgi:GT2 family glycosyltransferase